MVDGVLCQDKYPLHKVGYQDTIGWQLIDKPRPRVRFADAIAEAAKGAVIESCQSKVRYYVAHGYPVVQHGTTRIISVVELQGDWEIIEPEGDK